MISKESLLNILRGIKVSILIYGGVNTSIKIDGYSVDSHLKLKIDTDNLSTAMDLVEESTLNNFILTIK